ncbi:MAG: threonine ammonia-lyase [Mycoplasmoidaceae bacterium]
MKKEWVGLHDIHEANLNMKKSGLIYPTLVKYCPTLSNQFKAKLYHCAETVQAVKSFKIRGALNAIMHLTPAQKKKGVICASAGNHAQGTALSATTLGIKSYICMPSNAPLAKIQATKNFGGTVILAPEPSFDAAYALSKKLAKERGLTEIPPYDHPHVIAGQATVAVDILQKQPDIDMFIVPIGGGGLIAGIATYVKMLDPRIEVIGVQAENFPAMKKSFDAKKIISYCKGVPTLADGCAVKTPGSITFDIIKERVDKIVTVTEDEIARAINLLMEKGKIVSEGAGAMPTAAVMAGKINVKGRKVAMLISGGNIDLDTLYSASAHAMWLEGRRFKTIVYFKTKNEINQFLEFLGKNNTVSWTLDTEIKLTKDLKPGTYSIAVITPDKKTSEIVKSYIRKQKFFVRCF